MGNKTMPMSHQNNFNSYLGIHFMTLKSNKTLAISGIEVKEFSTRRAATRSLFSVREHRSIAIAPPNDLPKTII